MVIIQIFIITDKLAMTQKILAIILLIALVSPLAFQHNQPTKGQLYEQAAIFARKDLQPYSDTICQIGLYKLGTSLGVKNDLNKSQKIKPLGQYSQTGELLQQGVGQISKSRMSIFLESPQTPAGSSSGCMVYKILPKRYYLAVQFKNNSYAHICLRDIIDPQTCFKDIDVNPFGCIKFANSSSQRKLILKKAGYTISANANYIYKNGCRVQQIAVVVK